MATKSEIRKALQAAQKNRATETDFGPLMRRALEVEIRAEEAMRRQRGKHRTNWAYITKKKARYKQHPWLTGAGMAGRAGVVATRGTVSTTAKGVYKGSRLAGRAAKAAGRGYKKRVHPKVAGMSERAFTGNTTTALRGEARRLHARTRITRRRVAGRMHERADQRVPTRSHRMTRRSMVEHRVAEMVDPDRRNSRGGVTTRCASCNASFRTTAAAARHQCGAAEKQEQAAIRRARVHVAGQKPNNKSTPTRDGGSRSAPSAKTSSGGHTTMADKTTKNAKEAAKATDPSIRPKDNKGKHIDLRGQSPSNYWEWLALTWGKANEHATQADALGARIEEREGRKMDTRCLAPLYMAKELEQQIAKFYLTSYMESVRLYYSRVSQDDNSGRKMTDEDKFFNV